MLHPVSYGFINYSNSDTCTQACFSAQAIALDADKILSRIHVFIAPIFFFNIVFNKWLPCQENKFLWNHSYGSLKA